MGTQLHPSEVIGVGWGLSPHDSLSLLTASKKLQSVLNFGQMSDGNHNSYLLICWTPYLSRHMLNKLTNETKCLIYAYKLPQTGFHFDGRFQMSISYPVPLVPSLIPEKNLLDK